MSRKLSAESKAVGERYAFTWIENLRLPTCAIRRSSGDLADGFVTFVSAQVREAGGFDRSASRFEGALGSDVAARG
jgi:hypothetical protein